MGRGAETIQKVPGAARHLGWIDFLKGIAMLAVVVDHTKGLLYTNENIQKLSFFSVTLFVFLGGITAYLSMESKHITSYDRRYVWRRVKCVLIPYATVTAISVCALNHIFDLGTYLKELIGFSTWAPFYFVAFFLQLLIISPVLFLMIKIIERQKRKVLFYTASLVTVAWLSYLFTKYTFVVNAYTAGKMVLGGSYFFVFYLGLLFGSFHVTLRTPRQAILSSSIFAVLLILFIELYAGNAAIIQMLNGIFGIWQLNPPGTILLIYTALIFGTLGGFYRLCEMSFPGRLMQIFRPVEICGKYSLTIFLYHQLFKYWDNLFVSPFPSFYRNVLIYRLILIVFMIVVPVAGKWAYENIKKKIMLQANVVEGGDGFENHAEPA